MQGYGPRRRTVGVALVGLSVLILGACSLVEDKSGAKPIVIPTTDDLSTESKPSSIPATESNATERDRTLPAQWSYERVIKGAPRVSNSDYQQGATSENGPRESVSGYHFASAGRKIRCSTGNNGASALACITDKPVGPARPPASEDAGCQWDRNMIVLSSEAASAGECANRYPVLFRPQSIEPGSAITVDRFACLSDSQGLYCIDSRSGTGFSLTDAGYLQIKADDRAPQSLTGITGRDESEQPTSSIVPTR